MFTTYLITVQTIHHLKLKTIYFVLDRCPYRYENYLIWRKQYKFKKPPCKYDRKIEIVDNGGVFGALMTISLKLLSMHIINC